MVASWRVLLAVIVGSCVAITYVEAIPQLAAKVTPAAPGSQVAVDLPKANQKTVNPAGPVGGAVGKPKAGTPPAPAPVASPATATGPKPGPAPAAARAAAPVPAPSNARAGDTAPASGSAPSPNPALAAPEGSDQPNSTYEIPLEAKIVVGRKSCNPEDSGVGDFKDPGRFYLCMNSTDNQYSYIVPMRCRTGRFDEEQQRCVSYLPPAPERTHKDCKHIGQAMRSTHNCRCYFVCVKTSTPKVFTLEKFCQKTCNLHTNEQTTKSPIFN